MKIINWWIEMISLLLAGIGIVGYFRVSNFYAPIFAQFIGVGIAVFLITESYVGVTATNIIVVSIYHNITTISSLLMRKLDIWKEVI